MVSISPKDGSVYFLNAHAILHGTTHPPGQEFVDINNPTRLSVVLFRHEHLEFKDHGFWLHDKNHKDNKQK